jgi:para-nitrobenzyl esterase
MIGTCKDEMTMFAMSVDPAAVDRARVVAGARAHFGDHADDVVSVYERTRPAASPFELEIAIGTDAMRVGSIRIAERLARAGGAPVYTYRFDYESSLHDGRLGATHAIEIPFVFDTIERAGQMALHGDRPDAQAFADVVSETWLAFARTGDSNHSGLSSWPVYDEERRTTMVFDSPSHVVDDPDGEERRAWDQSLTTGI